MTVTRYETVLLLELSDDVYNRSLTVSVLAQEEGRATPHGCNTLHSSWSYVIARDDSRSVPKAALGKNLDGLQLRFYTSEYEYDPDKAVFGGDTAQYGAIYHCSARELAAKAKTATKLDKAIADFRSRRDGELDYPDTIDILRKFVGATKVAVITRRAGFYSDADWRIARFDEGAAGRAAWDLIDEMYYVLTKTHKPSASALKRKAEAEKRARENYEPTEVEQGLIPIPAGYAEQ